MIPRNGHENRPTSRTGKIAKMFLRDRLVRSGYSLVKNLIACITFIVVFYLPLRQPYCLVTVCLNTRIPTVLKFSLQLKTSATSGRAGSNKSAPIFYAAGTTSLGKNGNCIPIICARSMNSLPRCRPIPLLIGISTFLKATTFQRLFR